MGLETVLGCNANFNGMSISIDGLPEIPEDNTLSPKAVSMIIDRLYKFRMGAPRNLAIYIAGCMYAGCGLDEISLRSSMVTCVDDAHTPGVRVLSGATLTQG